MWCLYSTKSCFHSLQGSGERRRNSSTCLCWPLVCNWHVSNIFFLLLFIYFLLPVYTIAGLMVPLPVTVATLTMENYGYVIVGSPPIACAPVNTDLHFYTMVIITNIIVVIGIPLLIIVAWSLHKVLSV